MARPIILIKKELLDILAIKQHYGVPVCKLIKQHKLDITHPTLTKLLKYHSLTHPNPHASTIHTTVIASIFPAWLVDAKENIASQPVGCKYLGIMPFGEWASNE